MQRLEPADLVTIQDHFKPAARRKAEQELRRQQQRVENERTARRQKAKEIRKLIQARVENAALADLRGPKEESSEEQSRG